MVGQVISRQCLLKAVQVVVISLGLFISVPANAMPARSVGFDLGNVGQIIGELIEIKRECSAENLNKLLDELLNNAGGITIALQWILSEIDSRLNDPNLGDEERQELEETRAEICKLLYDIMNGRGKSVEISEDLIDDIVRFCNLSKSDIEQLRRKFNQLLDRWKFGADFLFNMYCVDTVGGGSGGGY